LHESQLNLKLLRPLGIETPVTLQQIPEYYGLSADPAQDLRTTDEPCRLILHPRSKGSAREWGTENFSRLIDLLPPEKFRIFITGTLEEGQSIKPFLDLYRNRVTDLTGTQSLDGLIDFIGGCDALVSASTGPLHIAAAMGKKTIGLYAPMHPIHPGRWAPVGKDAHFLVNGKEDCNDCRKSGDCHCIRSITPESVIRLLLPS
jgi:ADP-heptose:LPS heptosyltransferase